MEVVKTILMIAVSMIGIAMTVIILRQEGKSAGLGSLNGTQSDTYWSRNKGRPKRV